MSSIFPIRDTVTPDGDREPRLVDLDEETADEVFQALSSQTTRQIFLALHESPQTTSDLAEATDTSVQNVQYHLQKLRDSELVEVVDTWYSERGTEMKVYAPRDESLVLYAGRDKQRSLRNLLERVVGAFGVLLPGSLLAGLGASRYFDGGGDSAASDIDVGEHTVDTGANGAEADIESTDPGAGSMDIPENGEQPAGTITVDDEADAVDIAYTFDEGAMQANETPAVVVGNETVDPETVFDTELMTDAGNITLSATDFDIDGVTVHYAGENGTVSGEGGTFDDADLDLAGNLSDEPDSMETVTLPADWVNETLAAGTDPATGIDPALAAGVAFFLGGALVFASVLAWSGLR